MSFDLNEIEKSLHQAMGFENKDIRKTCLAGNAEIFIPKLVEEIKRLRSLSESQAKALDMMEAGTL